MEITIIGAGLAGLSAAITLAKKGIGCRLVSAQPSERAQSVLAEGGINGALNTMGEGDSPKEHCADTVKAGVYLADPEAVRGLCEAAPGIIRELMALGVPFNADRDDVPILRPFGGQKKKRTAYARSSTGKVIMTALIDEARKYEAAGLIKRYPHHAFLRLLFGGDGSCAGARVRDVFSGGRLDLCGPVILACGGMNGVFPGMTTGTAANTGDAAAALFSQGVRFGSLEMLQYHPTTVGIAGKRCLVTEAARGEGGRLFILRDGKPWYFMEEKYPELGNLMPRDVVAREMYFVSHAANGTDKGVFLDMTGLSEEVWRRRLPDLRAELIHYLGLDPKKTPVPVEPGIHYFMGGIDVDVRHRTNIENLLAAGECCSQYHGANRLGGNSMLGAVYGGRTAAETAAGLSAKSIAPGQPDVDETPASSALIREISGLLLEALGIVRDGATLLAALGRLDALEKRREYSVRERERLALARAMLCSAALRKESRGAHYRSDFPQTDPGLCRMTEAVFRDGRVRVQFKEERGTGPDGH